MEPGDLVSVKIGSFHNRRGSFNLPAKVYRVMAGGEYVILQFSGGDQIRARVGDVEVIDV